MAEKHIWTDEENKIVCEEYVRHYLIGKNNTSAGKFVKNVLRKCRELDGVDKDSSLIMKVYNTKSLVKAFGLGQCDTFNGGKLSHFSQKHKEQMLEVLRKYSLL